MRCIGYNVSYTDIRAVERLPNCPCNTCLKGYDKIDDFHQGYC